MARSADKPAPVQFPGDLAALTDEELSALHEAALAEFDAQADADAPDLARVTELADGIELVQAQAAARVAAAEERAAELAAQIARVHPPQADAAAETEVPEGDPEPDPAAEPEPVAAPPAVVTAATSVRARGPELTERLLAGQSVPQAKQRLNPSLSDIQARQRRDRGTLAARTQAVLTASADVPGVPLGAPLRDYGALTDALIARARNLPTTALGLDAPWYPVAALQQEFRHNLDMRATAKQVDEVLRAAADPDAMVAAGGWCAPSEISYDFYNVVCEDGQLDLPTVGISRGGMRWPTSASYADIVNNFWSWNETQDVAAVTGTAQSGTKTCFRVSCPSYNEQRLHCDGLCVTVGNLIEDAFPEAVANHTRLTMAGYSHRLNQLRINELLLSSNSTAITGYGAAGSGLVAPVLGALELCAIDYREKYAMCEDAVLEVVLPRWIRGAMRADLRKRTNGEMDFLAVTDAQLMNMFDVLRVRVQWVDDWQVRTTGLPGASTPIVVWPTSVQFLMYAAGTFVLGRGLQLNLGVVRDSVLNATNDHTGEWMEECWLIAKIGHESRLGTISICTDGTTGAADLTACVP